MNILILLVIVMFVVVGVYVGYHASQPVEGEEHNVDTELKILNERSEIIHIYQNPEHKELIL